MTIKRIHVNQHHIKANAKDGGSRPVFTIKEGGKTSYGSEVDILGPSWMVYNTDGLSCGAKCWVETEADLEVTNLMTYEEAKNYGID